MTYLAVTRCTRATPWDASLFSRGPVVHEDAMLVLSDYYGDDFECPNCGLRYEIVRDLIPPVETPGGTFSLFPIS